MSTSRLSKGVVNAGKGKVQIARKVGPVSTLDMGKFAALQGVSVAERKTHMNVLEKVTNFEQLRVHPAVKAAITANILKSPTMPPTPVQKVAIKSLTRRHTPGFRSWLIAAETGSGKTLAYLAPLMTKLLEAKERTAQQQSSAPEHLPEHDTEGPAIRSMVLVPTVELAQQVTETISQSVPRNVVSVAIFAGVQNTVSSLAKRVVQGVDIAVGTPDKLLKLQKTHPALAQRALEACSMLVVDEADSLLNESFEPSTSALISKCPELADLVFVTATIPRKFDRILRDKYPQTTRLATPSIHRLPRHIDFRVVEVWHRPYNNSKQLALQQGLYSMFHDNTEEGKVKRVVVFVNLKRDVDNLVNMLRQSGYDASGLEADRSNLAEFVEPQSLEESGGGRKMKVLVATDLVARGIDFHRVRNIILYDMPPSAADLLHRAGRTGRLGTKGRVLLLVSKKESKGWIRGLETIVKKGMALA